MLFTRFWTTALAVVLVPITMAGYVMLGGIAIAGGFLYAIRGGKDNKLLAYVRKENMRLAQR